MHDSSPHSDIFQYNARTDRWLACLPLLGVQAEAFLGTRGDVRDTRWDMFPALLGALAAQLLRDP